MEGWLAAKKQRSRCDHFLGSPGASPQLWAEGFTFPFPGTRQFIFVWSSASHFLCHGPYSFIFYMNGP